MGTLETIAVREDSEGWRVERCGRVLTPATTQEFAMIAALDAASRSFERGEHVQVIVVPRAHEPADLAASY